VPKHSEESKHAAGTRRVSRNSADTALVADRGPRARIGAILSGERVAFAAFDNLEELLAGAAESDPEVVILWIADPVASLARQVEPLRRKLERARIVMICADILRWSLRSALAGGVSGVVLEEEMTRTLGPCLQAVRAGQICVPREHWRQIEPPTLSAREKQILGLVVMGFMNSQIAERLFLAESTVKSHLSSAFSKLGVRSRNEAVSLILDAESGLGMGILGLGGEPLGRASGTAQLRPSATAQP
jgi:DNA-binding NarL/FixJ family response regulator